MRYCDGAHASSVHKHLDLHTKIEYNDNRAWKINSIRFAYNNNNKKDSNKGTSQLQSTKACIQHLSAGKMQSNGLANDASV